MGFNSGFKGLTLQNSKFCLQSALMCLVCISEQTALDFWSLGVTSCTSRNSTLCRKPNIYFVWISEIKSHYFSTRH